MKNNFDLRTFLTENKLTSNSKINENQLPEDTKSLKASDAFRQVGIDMNEPVLVITQDGSHGGQETKGIVSAREALNMFQQLRAKGMEDDKQDYYEFENELNFSAEGYEYKIAYFEEEATTTALMQKSGVSEKKVNERNDIVPTAELKATDAFRDAGIDMNKPVLVLTQDGGHGGQETKGTVSAEEALKMFQQLRAAGKGREDHYEFDNELNFSAEGYEYKLSYFEEESTTTILMQKSGVSEKKVNEEDFDSVDSLAAFTDTIQVVGYPKTVEDALKIIERYERDRDPVSREEAKDLVAGMRATDEDDFDRNITNLIVKAFNIKLKGVSEKKVNEQLASQAVQEFIAADNNGVSIAEFVKAMIDGAAEFNQEEAAYQDLDKRSEVILKAIGRQDLIGGTNETAPGYMHDCAAKVMHEKYGNGDCIPEEHTLIKEGNKYVVTHYDVLFESGKTVKDIPVEELKIITESNHGHKRRKK